MRHARTFLMRASLATMIVAGAAYAAQAEMVYYRGNTGEPESLDQHVTSTIYESNILRDLYEGLVANDAGGRVMPGVAETWDISDDGTVYTFHLRDDAMWSDGTPVTAHDFVFSLQRILDPATGGKYANILYPIVNAEAANKGEIEPIDIGAVALDDRTLQITLEQPTPYFLELLKHQTGLPVQKAAVEAHGTDFVRPENMASNGAYMLDEWVPNSHIKLVKNPHFHDAENVAIDTIMYIPTEDRAAAYRAMRAGELHSNNDYPNELVDQILTETPGMLRNTAYLGTYYYAVNHEHPVLSDPQVRQALSMAIDREYLVEEITGGGQIPAYGWVPPGINNYMDAPYEADYAALSMFDREESAIEILTAAGYGPDNPFDLTIHYNTSENHRKVALAIADMWSPLGVNVDLFNSDVATHYAHLRDRGDFDVARAGWIGDYSDPQNFLFMVESDNTGFNYARYVNPEYDGLMDAAAKMTDLDARAQVLRQAESMFMRDLPFIPIYYYVTPNLVGDKVLGWEDNVLNVHPTRFMSIAE